MERRCGSCRYSKRYDYKQRTESEVDKQLQCTISSCTCSLNTPHKPSCKSKQEEHIPSHSYHTSDQFNTCEDHCTHRYKFCPVVTFDNDLIPMHTIWTMYIHIASGSTVTHNCSVLNFFLYDIQ